MAIPHVTARFETPEQFLHAFQTEISAGGMLVRGATLPGGHPAVGDCEVELQIASDAPLRLSATIAASIPSVGVAVLFKDPAPLRAVAERLRAGAVVPSAQGEASGTVEAEEEPPEEPSDEEPAPVAGSPAARLKAMTVAEKMQLAISADRSMRAALFRDTNKSLHQYVLRNPRIGLDEVQSAAKLATLAPDAFKFIAEHKEWGQNPAVCTALARNPRTPIPLVLRVLPRVPHQELRAIAKGAARAPIVQAVRKMLNE